ncbi:MAG: alpha/beta fold hydrolase [Saprospiraceae bacterium]
MQLIDILNQDGSTSKITHFPSSLDQSKSVIIIFPAMGVRGSYYEILGKQISEAGFEVIISDLRGIGNSSIRPNKKVDFGYYEMIELDYKNILEKVKTIFPNKKIFALGHSLGGQLASLFSAKNPNSFDGLILIACCSVYFKGWGMKQYPTLLMTQFFYFVNVLLGYFPGKKMGFGGTEAKTVMSDWNSQARTGKYVLKNDDFNFEVALGKMTIPILVISFQADTFAPRKAVEHLIGKFGTNAKKEYIYLKNDDLRNKNFGHFNWAKKPQEIVSLIGEWIR